MGAPEKIINATRALYIYIQFLQSDAQRTHLSASFYRSTCWSFLMVHTLLLTLLLNTTDNKRRGIEWDITNVLEDLCYADDMCLLSHTRGDLQA